MDGSVLEGRDGYLLPSTQELESSSVSGPSCTILRAHRVHASTDTVDMTFRVVLERDPETGDYSAVCPELPGCASAGDTEAEARANIREAIELYLMPGDINLPEDAKLFEVTIG